MKITIHLFIIFSLSLCLNDVSGQNINSENTEVRLIQSPKISVSPEFRNYKVRVISPYNLTAEDIIKNSGAEHQKTLADYGKIVNESVMDHRRKLKDHDGEIKTAKEKYEIEMAAFKIVDNAVPASQL